MQRNVAGLSDLCPAKCGIRPSSANEQDNTRQRLHEEPHGAAIKTRLEKINVVGFIWSLL
jgi:hypothetical protein